MFLTNNSSKSVSAYVEKLHSLGIPSKADDFFTSAQATISYLKGKRYRLLYVLGTKSFLHQLRDAGLNVTTCIKEGIDCLVMGFDTELHFQKLEDACILLGKGIDYVATNPDLVCPTAYGYVPDCGSVTQMLQNATGRRPVVIGKPQPEMVYSALKLTGFTKGDAVMIGDRLYTDIASGNNAGIDTILVLSGESTRADIDRTGIEPTYIFDNIQTVYEYLAETTISY